jgi:hypothetical protein
MFTLLVSWLLVACIPGLLMLTTLGLGRLERDFAHATVTATDVAEFLEHADAADVQKLARDGMPEALDCLHRRQAQRFHHSAQPGPPAGTHRVMPFFAADIGDHGEGGLPTRMHTHSRVNPQFNDARHVNPV